MRLVARLALSLAVFLAGAPVLAAEARVLRNVRLYAGPSSAFPSLRTLIAPELLEVLDANPGGRYIEVRTGAGDQGWVYRYYVALVDDVVEAEPTAAAEELSPEEGQVLVRVADVGAGLCSFAKLPGDHVVIIDTYKSATCAEELETFLGSEPASQIDLMIISHSDYDHYGGAVQFLEDYEVQRVVHTGYPRKGKASWCKLDLALAKEFGQWSGDTDEETQVLETCKQQAVPVKRSFELTSAAEPRRDINLGHADLPPGATYEFGGALLTFIAGEHMPPSAWEVGDFEDSHHRNAASVVVKLQYAGRSILFAGDAVGLHDKRDDDDHCIGTEARMLDLHERWPTVDLDSDVLIAAHHGADNANCMPFIEAVSPSYVVFSAGGQYGHPRATTAQRFLTYGLPPDQLLRTDRGDDRDRQPGALFAATPDWDHLAVPGCADAKGDDSIDISITDRGHLAIGYVLPNDGGLRCDQRSAGAP